MIIFYFFNIYSMRKYFRFIIIDQHKLRIWSSKNFVVRNFYFNATRLEIACKGRINSRLRAKSE